MTAYQPPSIVAFSWRAPSWDADAITQVEIRFSAETGGTRIEFEHRGWEQSAKTREARNGYDSGWGTMLGHYQAAFAATDDPMSDTRKEKADETLLFSFAEPAEG